MQKGVGLVVVKLVVAEADVEVRIRIVQVDDRGRPGTNSVKLFLP